MTETAPGIATAKANNMFIHFFYKSLYGRIHITLDTAQLNHFDTTAPFSFGFL